MGPGSRRSAAIAAVVTAVAATGIAPSDQAAALSVPTVRTVLAGNGDGTARFQIANTQCSFASDVIKGTPWSLQRILFKQLWQNTTGLGVLVAVIDTGVDDKNVQLSQAVSRKDSSQGTPGGTDYITPGGDGTTDPVGHGTKVAGIIAARPLPGTGFVGLAPGATILPIRQNDNQGGGTVATMVKAIKYAVDSGAKVINISQDTSQAMPANSSLEQAVKYAERQDVLIVASAGNGGASDKVKLTYPASYDGVLAVAASDRNNAPASFSQPGPFVGVAAPGVDMVSTVPGGGHCVDQGTSFSAPYVSGVAALIRARHPKWSYRQVITQIEQTADRTIRTRDNYLGWGVVDPVAAVNDDTTTPQAAPTPDPVAQANGNTKVQAATVLLGESEDERNQRYAVYAVAGAGGLVALLIGGGVVMGDWRRKQGIDVGRKNGEVTS
ncbi:type VII secretion-associated serine protease mycosin [Actinacidiphila oryziradicis]|uniref:Type VII secretion-associated serine protease mycosin n=1 Tax=Actinacidiphila oryziradicis TaxID=2571141 RepID=A0A4U0S8P0_9ACTN|nr:type VII secretion-associated serine protease mycosin [Actinacidiphila oryziradicis]